MFSNLEVKMALQNIPSSINLSHVKSAMEKSVLNATNGKYFIFKRPVIHGQMKHILYISFCIFS